MADSFNIPSAQELRDSTQEEVSVPTNPDVRQSMVNVCLKQIAQCLEEVRSAHKASTWYRRTYACFDISPLKLEEVKEPLVQKGFEVDETLTSSRIAVVSWGDLPIDADYTQPFLIDFDGTGYGFKKVPSRR